jgi:predicted amidophosphoribosyltransferase
MSGSCMKCGASLDGSWKFCPYCGGAMNTPAKIHPHHEHEKAPAKYAFSGVLFGIITAPALIIYGTMICLLGPAMVLGIPLIIAGIAAPFLGPFLAINAIRGNCPWCGAKITSVGPLDAFFCHACSKRIEVRNRELVRAA